MELITCESFEESPETHRHEVENNERVYQMMFSWPDGSNCAGIYTEDELVSIMAVPTVLNTFCFIGQDADIWNNEEFRNRICDRIEKLMDERK